MKLGTCLLLLASDDDPLAKAAIPVIGRSGYHYAEISLARLFPLTDDQILAYRDLFQNVHLSVDVFNNALPKGMALIGPSADSKTLSSYISRALHLAELMGVSMITMSGPNRRTVPADYTWEQGFPEYIRFLRSFADEAASQNITLIIEPINDEERSFISTVPAALKTILAAGRDNIKTMIDSYHFYKQKDDLAFLLDHISSIAHIHYAALPGRTYPLKADMPACKYLLSQLLDAGYQGRLSIEAYTPDLQSDLQETRTLLSQYLSSRT